MRARSLLGSVRAYFLFVMLAAVGALTVLSTSLLYLRSLRNDSQMSVYEVSRAVHGLPLARTPPRIRATVRAEAPPQPRPGAEATVSAALAARLSLPGGAVRVRLGEGDRNRAPEIARELALYGAAADPAIHGPFTIAVRQRDGRWLYLTTHRFPSVGVIGIGALSALVNLLLIGVSLWFGGRVAGPLRQFAASAERLRADAEVEPIPVTGPTELRAAAEALNHMQQRISRYVRERTSMIGAIAHDLRAPLSRLKFHVVSAPPKLRAAVEREIAEMEQLVGVTLDFVEADTRSGAFERLELSLLVEGIADDFADAGKDVEVVETAPLTICGNALLLRRLFTNLIDNALKYGGSARVRTCRENGCAIVEIDDVGPGLAPDDLARAFEPFFRGEKSRSRSTGGVGLGLAIARSAAVAHAGSIVLENLPERGLRARVFLSPSENA